MKGKQLKRELPSKWATWIQNQTIPLRLSCLDLQDWPAVLSLWYLYENERIYCATQLSARVVQYLGENPRCAFEISTNKPPYMGVRGRGLVEIDSSKGQEILEELLVRYLGDLELPLAKRLLAKSNNEAALIITPTRWSCWDFSKRMKGSY